MQLDLSYRISMPVRRRVIEFPDMQHPSAIVFDPLPGTAHWFAKDGKENQCFGVYPLADIPQWSGNIPDELVPIKILYEKSVRHFNEEQLLKPDEDQNADLFEQLESLSQMPKFKADHGSVIGNRAYGIFDRTAQTARFFIAGYQRMTDDNQIAIKPIRYKKSSGIVLFQGNINDWKTDRFFTIINEPIVIGHDQDLIPMTENIFYNLFLLAHPNHDQTRGWWGGKTERYSLPHVA